MHLTPIKPSELFQQRFLLGPKIGGSFNHDTNQLVATPTTVQIDDALSSEPKDTARLCTGRHLHFDLPFERRGLNISAKSGLWEADGQLADHLIVMPLKKRMLSHLNGDIQVASNTASWAGFSFST